MSLSYCAERVSSGNQRLCKKLEINMESIELKIWKARRKALLREIGIGNGNYEYDRERLIEHEKTKPLIKLEVGLEKTTRTVHTKDSRPPKTAKWKIEIDFTSSMIERLCSSLYGEMWGDMSKEDIVMRSLMNAFKDHPQFKVKT